MIGRYIDGEMAAGGYSGLGSVMFSSDGRRVAWVSGRAGKALAVIDAVESPAYDDFGGSSLNGVLAGEFHIVRSAPTPHTTPTRWSGTSACSW